MIPVTERMPSKPRWRRPLDEPLDAAVEEDGAGAMFADLVDAVDLVMGTDSATVTVGCSSADLKLSSSFGSGAGTGGMM